MLCPLLSREINTNCFTVRSVSLALSPSLSPSLSVLLFGGKLVGFAARLMNRWQGPRSRFRTEITRKAAPPCRVFNWVSAELAPHPYLYSYIWRGEALHRLAQHRIIIRQTVGKVGKLCETLQSQVEKRLDTKAKQSAKKLLLLDAECGGGEGAWQLHSSPCQLQCFFPTTFSLASFRRLFPASPGESPKRIGEPAKSYDTPRRSAATATASASAAAPPVATFCMIYVPLGVARQLCTSSVRGVQACSVRCSGTCLFFFAKTFHFIA